MAEHRLLAGVERWAGSIASLLLCICLLWASTRAYAAPAPIECGAVVTQNIKLLADVGPCSGDGLIVAANGVSINLNGHKVFATQRLNMGIRLDNVSNVSVVGGTVEGFDTGVLIVGGLADKVTYMTVQNNRFGIQVQSSPSSGHQISKNVARNNRLIGILLSPNVSGATVNMNSVSGNVGYGIVLDGGSSMNIISANSAFGNGAHQDIALRGGFFEILRINVTSPLLALVSPSQVSYVNGVDYQVLEADGGGDATGLLVPVGITLGDAATSAENPIPADTSTSGCQMSDYIAAGFQIGNVALVQRGTCELDVKVNNARRAGAAAIILFNEGQAPTRTTFDFGALALPLGSGIGGPGIAVEVSYSLGLQLYNLSRAGPATIRFAANTSVQQLVRAVTSNNQIIKNSADNGHDDAAGQATSPDIVICGSNEWIKNLLGNVGDPAFTLCTSSGLGGSGATIHSY